jgi:hypothetical protein
MLFSLVTFIRGIPNKKSPLKKSAGFKICFASPEGQGKFILFQSSLVANGKLVAAFCTAAG